MVACTPVAMGECNYDPTWSLPHGQGHTHVAS